MAQADKQVQEEDATKLQFGDFADGEALTLTDVQALLMHARSAPGAPPPPDNKWVMLLLYGSTIVLDVELMTGCTS